MYCRCTAHHAYNCLCTAYVLEMYCTPCITTADVLHVSLLPIMYIACVLQMYTDCTECCCTMYCTCTGCVLLIYCTRTACVGTHLLSCMYAVQTVLCTARVLHVWAPTCCHASPPAPALMQAWSASSSRTPCPTPPSLRGARTPTHSRTYSLRSPSSTAWSAAGGADPETTKPSAIV